MENVMQDQTQAMRARGLTIAHATDLRDEERSAFVHAVALSLRSESKLLSLHVNDDAAALSRIPHAVELLTRWGLLPSGSLAGDESKLQMQHERVVDNCCDDPVDTLVRALKKEQPQLLIGATSSREGLLRAALGSVAESVALHVRAPTLLFPYGCRPFVSEETGGITLRRILVAAGDAEATEAGIMHAVWLADLAGAIEVNVELLHVLHGQDGAAAPSRPLPKRAGLTFHYEAAPGSVEGALLERAESQQVDVIVMATRGHDSLRDALLGSHAERVLRRAPCPLLAVPIS